MRSVIHYRNEPFEAIVEGQGDEPIRLTPCVIDELGSCGVAIIYPDGHGSSWGLMVPRNLIASWRATEIIRHYDRIENGTLHDAYYTGLRKPHGSEKETVEKVAERIGRGRYREIMAMPVPEEIIRAILDNQENTEERPAPDLWPIADEVKAGTLKWRQEFADAGLEHPDETARKQKDYQTTLDGFDSLLASVAKARHLPRKCKGMTDVENALLNLCEEGIEREYGDRIAVAVAGVAGDLMGADFARFMMPAIAPRSEDELYRNSERRKRDAVRVMNDWLNSLTPEGARWWHIRRRAASEPVDHSELLLRLVNKHFPAQNQELAKQVSDEFDRLAS